jgi:hypothetical protein
MENDRNKLTLDQPATYQIKVPGELDKSWSDWAGGMTIAVESEGDAPPVTTLTGIVADQAALQGLLRRLYSVGLPLISVVCVEQIDATRQVSLLKRSDISAKATPKARW